jgi:hypothetical protein
MALFFNVEDVILFIAHSDVLASFIAIGYWHIQIQYNKIKVHPLVMYLKGLMAIDGGDGFHSCLLENELKHFQLHGFIVRD